MIIGSFTTWLAGSLRPIYFLLGVLGPFTFLGHPWPFLIMRPHGFLLTPLGFPDPITLSFILGAHRLAINPLLSLLALLRASCSPFSLFYIAYCPWVYYFSLSGFLYPIYFFLGILGPFAFLEHPWPFFLILRSHGLLLISLGFTSPITVSFILGVHGLSINPLLSLLALIRVCCDTFSLFYITFCLWVCYFSLSRLL